MMQARPSSGERLPAAVLALSVLLSLSACGAGSAPHDPPCASDEYEYVDQLCGTLPDGGSDCSTVGDGLCYQRCEADSECSSGYRCVRIGLFAGGDWNCNDTVRVCADREDADCP